MLAVLCQDTITELIPATTVVMFAGGGTKVIGPTLTGALEIVVEIPETTAVVLAMTKIVLMPAGSVTLLVHVVLLVEVAANRYVTPPSREYQIELLAALVPVKVMTPADVGDVVVVTAGAATVGAV